MPTAAEVQTLVRDHVPLVAHRVRCLSRRLPGHVDRDDLTSAGLTALVASAQGYDPARGVSFARFAAPRVQGALQDELRGLDWASRSVRSRFRQVERVRAELTERYGRNPTTAEVAGAAGLPAREVDAVTDGVRRAGLLSLQNLGPDTAADTVPDVSPGPEERVLLRELTGRLRGAVDALPTRHRSVINRYYLDETPMAVIAAELGVSESRVSQLRAEAVSRLRECLDAA